MCDKQYTVAIHSSYDKSLINKFKFNSIQFEVRWASKLNKLLPFTDLKRVTAC